MLNFSGRHTLPVIIQSEASECGLACLAMVASYYGHRIDLNTLRRQHPISLNGVTLRSVIEIARHLHFTTRAIRLEPEDLRHARFPRGVRTILCSAAARPPGKYSITTIRTAP